LRELAKGHVRAPFCPQLKVVSCFHSHIIFYSLDLAS